MVAAARTGHSGNDLEGDSSYGKLPFTSQKRTGWRSDDVVDDEKKRSISSGAWGTCELGNGKASRWVKVGFGNGGSESPGAPTPTASVRKSGLLSAGPFLIIPGILCVVDDIFDGRGVLTFQPCFGGRYIGQRSPPCPRFNVNPAFAREERIKQVPSQRDTQ